MELSADGWWAAEGEPTVWEALEQKLLIGFYVSQPQLVVVIGPFGRRRPRGTAPGQGASDRAKDSVTAAARRRDGNLHGRTQLSARRSPMALRPAAIVEPDLIATRSRRCQCPAVPLFGSAARVKRPRSADADAVIADRPD